MPLRVKLNRHEQKWSNDLHLDRVEQKIIQNRNVTLFSASTILLEDSIYQKESSKVFILIEEIPSFIEIETEQHAAEFTFITLVTHDADSIEKTLIEMVKNHENLLNIHRNEWQNFWSENSISVDGNVELSQSIRSSLYAIASSLPTLKPYGISAPFYGLSPSGLGLGGPMLEAYRGHGFWDTEIWMQPVILLLEPRWSRELLNYRFMMRSAAYDNAKKTGYDGLR